MELQQTDTLRRLAHAVAAESAACIRYRLYAEKAEDEGSAALARLLREIADNEAIHARVFLEHLAEGMPGPLESLPVEGEYPFVLASSLENIESAARTEEMEYSTRYPAYAADAVREGFPQVAASFERVAAVEHAHCDILTQAAQQMRSQTLYTDSQPTVWRCMRCGHSAVQTAAWPRCPLCGAGQGYVLHHIGFPSY